MRQVTQLELVQEYVSSRPPNEWCDNDRTRLKEAMINVRSTIQHTGATHLVLFANPDFWSSDCGHRTIMVVGPTCTYKTIADCEGMHLYDLPSQREYPQVWCEVMP